MKWIKKHWHILYMLMVIIGGHALIPLQGEAQDAYQRIAPPSILSTAYRDGKQTIISKSLEDDSSGGEDAPSQGNLNGAIQWIMGKGNFANVGLLIGPTSGSTKIDITSTAQTTEGLDQSGIAHLDNIIGGGDTQAYYQFGVAMTRLLDEARTHDTSSVTVSQLADNLTASITGIAQIGVVFLREWNPAPVILSFYDSSVLNNEVYGQNKLIQLINGNKGATAFIQFFGDEVFNGMSRSWYLTTAVTVLSFVIYFVFRKFSHGPRAGAQFRKGMLQIAIAGLAIPLAANLLSWGINAMSLDVQKSLDTTEDRLLSSNLNIVDWFYNTNFAIPSGYELRVENGRFVFTPELIREINNMSIINKTSRGAKSITQLVGEAAKDHALGKKDADYKELSPAGQRIVSMTILNNNSFQTAFQESYGQNVEQAIFGGSTAWSTVPLVKLAQAMGEAKEWKPDEALKGEGTHYLTAGRMNYAVTEAGYAFSQSGGGYGMSPIAAYNLLNTHFDENGMRVKSNIEPALVPNVAMNVGREQLSEQAAPWFIRMIAVIIVMYASLKVLIDILTTGFGGLLAGAGGTAFGKFDSFGRLMGAIMALLLGIVGVSVLTAFTVYLIDVAWGITAQMAGGLNSTVDDLLSPVKKKLNEIWFIGPAISAMLENGAGIAVLLMAIFFVPTAAKVPITAFGSFIQSIPDSMAERFRHWGASFTGAGAPPGMSTGHIRNAMAQARQNDAARLTAIMSGASALGGAALGTAGNFLAGKSGDQSHLSVTNEVNDNDTANVTPSSGSQGPNVPKGVDRVSDEKSTVLQQDNTVQDSKESTEHAPTSGETITHDTQSSQELQQSSESSTEGIQTTATQHSTGGTFQKESGHTSSSTGTHTESKGISDKSMSPTNGDLYQSNENHQLESNAGQILNETGVKSIDASQHGQQTSVSGVSNNHQSLNAKQQNQMIQSDNIDAKNIEGNQVQVDKEGQKHEPRSFTQQVKDKAQSSVESAKQTLQQKAPSVYKGLQTGKQVAHKAASSAKTVGEKTKDVGKQVADKGKRAYVATANVAGKAKATVDKGVGTASHKVSQYKAARVTGEVLQRISGGKTLGKEGLAGAAHIAGGLTGTQNITQKGMDKTGASKGMGQQPMNQIRDGKPAIQATDIERMPRPPKPKSVSPKSTNNKRPPKRR